MLSFFVDMEDLDIDGEGIRVVVNEVGLDWLCRKRPNGFLAQFDFGLCFSHKKTHKVVGGETFVGVNLQ